MDTIGNMLTSLINAQRVHKQRVAVPYSRFKQSLAQIFQDKGLISTWRVQEGPRPQLIMTLAYVNESSTSAQGEMSFSGRPAISGVRRLSRPGQRRYAQSARIPYATTGVGTIIVSTPQGLMDDAKARELGLGGELVCEIW